MSRYIWEAKFETWCQPASNTEEIKCENAFSMIKDAVRKDGTLNSKNIKIISQGSYANNTNTRTSSDVDLCVALYDTVFTYFEEDSPYNSEKLGYVSAGYSFDAYRRDVGTALRNKFGISGVAQGNKAFDVHSNSYRVDADVVACLEYRVFTRFTGKDYISGIKFITANGNPVINFPIQHKNNGILKNNTTQRMYKRMVRIIKRLRYKMLDENVASADGVSSFLLECVLYNCPNKLFTVPRYYYDCLIGILEYIVDNTSNLSDCNDWTEVNDIKWLFRGTHNTNQPWTHRQVFDFASDALRYLRS